MDITLSVTHCSSDHPVSINSGVWLYTTLSLTQCSVSSTYPEWSGSIFCFLCVLKRSGLVWFHSNYSLLMESGWQRYCGGTQCAWFPLAVAGSGPAATMFSLSGRRTAVFSSPSLETAKENRCSKWHLSLIAPRGVFQKIVSYFVNTPVL